MSKKILDFCMEKGFLVNKDVLDLFGDSDVNSVKFIIESVMDCVNQKVLTKRVFEDNKDKLNEFFLKMPEESQRDFERLKIKLGISIEIFKEEECSESGKKVNVYPIEIPVAKKIEVKDFVNYFRTRVSNIKSILRDRSELENLISINKISGHRSNFSLIGIVSDKVVTKNGNLMFKIEDLTGSVKVLVNKDRKEVFQRAEDIALDSVLGFKGSGNSEIFFVEDFIFPDCRLPERKCSFEEECVLFLGDVHVGSDLFMEENFLRFIDYLNSDSPEVSKIKYLVIAGDLVTGIGNYPNQERDLKIYELEEQFKKVAELLGKIRSDINIIISPGNHDCVRLMEPQPELDRFHARFLYELPNVSVVGNPSYVNLGAGKDFSGFDVLLYHGVSYYYYAGNIPSLVKEKAIHKPEKIINYLLRYRHLAPTHSSVQYFPSENDCHFIEKIPDIVVSGHLHKSGISYYNNILVVSTSTWEAMTPYMEKVGSKPDFCKVPMFNLKTREIRILDFE